MGGVSRGFFIFLLFSDFVGGFFIVYGGTLKKAMAPYEPPGAKLVKVASL